jgi:hypothetical protein
MLFHTYLHPASAKQTRSGICTLVAANQTVKSKSNLVKTSIVQDGDADNELYISHIHRAGTTSNPTYCTTARPLHCRNTTKAFCTVPTLTLRNYLPRTQGQLKEGFSTSRSMYRTLCPHISGAALTSHHSPRAIIDLIIDRS